MEDIVDNERFLNITHFSEVCDSKTKAYSVLRDLYRFLGVKRFAIIQRYRTSFISCNINHVPLDKSIELAHSIIDSANARYQISKWVEIRDVLEKIKLLDAEYKGFVPNTSDVFIEHRIGKTGVCMRANEKKDKKKNDFVKKFNETYGEKNKSKATILP